MTTRAAGITSFILFLSACGGGNQATSASTTGASTGSATTTGGTAGNLAAGAHCSSDAQCASGVCGVGGSGNCCGAACVTGDAGCGATACDDTGACQYPDNTVACGSPSCSASQLTNSSCDGNGGCTARASTACPENLACKDAASCQTACAGAGDCATGFYCNSGTCTAVQSSGACAENDACSSGVCGISGTGNCCTAACPATADPACAATACDAATGACVYAAGGFCAGTCSGTSLNAGVCDSTGACGAPTTVTCPGNLVCNSAGTGCLAACTQLSDCAGGYYCNAGTCAQIQPTGPCASNDACTSGICGVAGTGNCCTAVCSTDDPACGATGCDGTGVCVFPSTKTTCGDGGLACSDGTQTNLPACDGAGTCLAATTTDCTPFVCGTNACLAKCTDATACIPGDVCDDDPAIKNGACCAPLVSGDTILVDGSTGSDHTACCGYGGAGACRTLSHAMTLIDAAQATGVTITATMKGAGGNWGGERAYPVVLGWGVELNAPGIYFYDANQQGNTALFEIDNYSKTDTAGYASIVGGAASPVGIGMNLANNVQTQAETAITVEKKNTLYIANAVVNASATNSNPMLSGSVAILVEAEGNLVLAQDQSGANTGTVTVGNALGEQATDGWIGLFCDTDGVSTGCSITDAALDGGPSLVVQGQEDIDIAVDDFGSVVLTSSPVIGVPPSKTGFGNCPAKVDGQSFNQGAAIIAQSSTFKMTGGVVQCIDGPGVIGEFDDNNGVDTAPVITLDGVTIQNTDLGLGVAGGTATVSSSTIQFNYWGVWQVDDSEALGSSTIDLSAGGNTVVCSSLNEASQETNEPGMSVYNEGSQPLNAANLAWDTSGPDYFDCDNTVTSCTCNLGSCSLAAGGDGMSAVEDSTNKGGITFTGNTLSTISCD